MLILICSVLCFFKKLVFTLILYLFWIITIILVKPNLLKKNYLKNLKLAF